MGRDVDICIIGSGAGAAPVAFELSQAGHSVLVLEKGPWFTEKDFYKDELACCRHSVYTPELRDEPQVLEDKGDNGEWQAESNAESGRDFWNGNCVGGSSNFMSGFFYRLKPVDFRLRSEFGPIDGANVADWPIGYEQLEPYYAKVEKEVGISGRVVAHAFAEPRSTKDYPYPPTLEHPIAADIDAACRDLGYTPLPIARAILSRPVGERRSCEYSGYCGSYGCSSGAKGSARAALLNRAVASGRCRIYANARVTKLRSDRRGRAIEAHYIDAEGKARRVSARVFVVACQAIETARLLLYSTGPRHAQGLGNRHNQVGKNLLFSAGGSGGGDFEYSRLPQARAKALQLRGPFVNRGLQDWYVIDDKAIGGRIKGGTIDFLLRHPNPISRALDEKWDDGRLVWGAELQRRLKSAFTGTQSLRFETFCDWLPTDDCNVNLDPAVVDRWQIPVARVRLGFHPHDLRVGRYLTDKAEQVLRRMGADNVRGSVSGRPPPNLVAGGCRFGTDPRTSVLDADCRIHDAPNVYVTDGSFMPTGGSVPYTWTIYANAFRVADVIKTAL